MWQSTSRLLTSSVRAMRASRRSRGVVQSPCMCWCVCSFASSMPKTFELFHTSPAHQRIAVIPSRQSCHAYLLWVLPCCLIQIPIGVFTLGSRVRRPGFEFMSYPEVTTIRAGCTSLPKPKPIGPARFLPSPHPSSSQRRCAAWWARPLGMCSCTTCLVCCGFSSLLLSWLSISETIP